MIHRTLKAIRQYHCYTQSELAKKLAISNSYLSEIESGKKSIAYDLLEKYSVIFDIPVSSLVFLSESVTQGKEVPEKFKTLFTRKIVMLIEWINERTKEKEA